MNYIQLACLADLVRHQGNEEGLFVPKMVQLKDADADQTAMDMADGADGYSLLAKTLF